MLRGNGPLPRLVFFKEPSYYESGKIAVSFTFSYTLKILRTDY